MKKTLLFALLAWLYLGVTGTAQAQCTSYAGGPYSDQGIDVAGCNGVTLSAPYAAWLNEVYYTDVVAGGNYTFSFCDGYSAATWGGEATITAILNGTPSGAPPGTIDGGTLLGTATGCSFTFDAPEDGTVFFVLSTASSCGGAILEEDNGTPSITTNSGVECSTECNTTSVWATFSATGQPSVSPTPVAFCESFFTGVDAPVAYIAVAVFPGDGVSYTFSNEDGFPFFSSTAEGFVPTTEFAPGFIGFMQITDELIAAAGATTTIQFNGATASGVPCAASLTINWATDFPGLSVADVCTGGGGGSTPGADVCADALLLNIANGTINGPYSNIAATGADTLTPPECFGDDIDPATGENIYDNEVWFYFVGDGSTVTLTTSVAGAPSPMPNADTQMGVYIGACTELIEIACNDDIDLEGENYLSSVTIETFPGETYYVVIDGYYYSSGPDAGDFFINVTTEGGGDDCEANFGTVTPPAQTTICQDGILGAFTIDGDNTSADYFSIFVVTSGANLTILGYIQEGSATDFTGLPPGQYTYHAFNVAVADVETVDNAVAGGATGVDVANLIATGVICADLDVTGVTVTVLPSTDPACSGTTCEANYGEVVFGNTVICEGSCTDPIFVTGDNTLGYATVLVITQGEELTILEVAEQGPLCFVDYAPGDYTIHAFNFDLDDLETIVGALESGAVTTGGQVAELIADGVICAQLDVTGIVVTVLSADDPLCTPPPTCDADFGTVVFGSTTVCEGGSSDAVFVEGDYTDGFATVLVITQGDDLTIVGLADQGNIDFAGFAPGSYTVHAFNFDLNDLETILDAIETGAITTGGQVAGLIADGTLCAALDVAGVVFTVLSADDPLCTPPPTCDADFGTVVFGSTTVCEGGSSDAVFVEGDYTDGFATALVITQGDDLTIVGLADQGNIDFAGFAPGSYTVHAFNFDLNDLETILDALETGAITTGGQVAGLIADGTLCAALDVAGVVFTVLSADDPICAPFVCEAGYGEVSFGSTTVCEGGSSDEVFVTGDNTNGYTTLLVITQGEELNIVGVVGQGSIDFTGLEPGDYTIHAFNFFDGDFDAIVAALESGAVTTGGQVAQLIAEGAICADLDVTGVVFTVLPTGDEACQLPPIANSDFFFIGPGTANFEIPLFAYIFDPNGDELTVTIEQPADGVASYDAASGVLTFFPDAGFVGTVVIPFSVTDGFFTVDATMTITIQLSCELLNPISLGVIAIVTNPNTGNSTAFINVSGGLPEFNGSNYTINIFESPGVVLYSANDVPGSGIYEVPAFSTDTSTVTVTISDDLGCTNDFVVAVSGVTLPVSLLNFTGTVETRGNLLEWTAASETNNAYYTLYRSADGINYQKIAQVEGKGTTSVASAYSFFDVNAPNGLAYYQLTQTNFDGTAATLSTIVLRRDITALNVVQVAPVPASNTVNVTYTAATAADVKVSLFDIAGKLVSEQTVNATAGINNIEVSVTNLAAGMYVLMLNNGAEVVNAKIVKE